jgi:hypothetical protein
MASLYGKLWFDSWGDTPIDEMKADWIDAIRRNKISLMAVFKACDKCADEGVVFPPTLPQFIQLCKASKPSEMTKAIGRQFTQEELQKNHERMTEISTSMTAKSKTDYKAWVKRILANHERFPENSVKAAKEVEAMTA